MNGKYNIAITDFGASREMVKSDKIPKNDDF